ncbi:MAG: HNH endonuclease signature motif containing protein [Pirellulales bacterium]
MSSCVGPEMRRQVASRADHRCEYCLIRQSDTYFGCEIDHIIAEKHGGQSTAENLAFCCALCNRAKGTDIASYDESTGGFVRLYHPRTDRWEDHFEIDGPFIRPLTIIGQMTVRLLGLNRSDRVSERQAIRESQT